MQNLMQFTDVNSATMHFPIIPCNMAPLNFRVPEADWMEVKVSAANRRLHSRLQ
ncbi:hypothetical protein JQM83_06400 [Parabacteroides distasonis]|nr:hypothetical protein [Parabacteroides distasonis]